MAGGVHVNGRMVDKPGKQVPRDATIAIQKPDIPFVSRGGLKLQKAIEYFDVDVAGKTAIDVGASTGGFTDCLLQNGAAFVYAVDVGYGQLDWKLRNDKRVEVIERTNIRYVRQEQFQREIDLATIDVSFISLTIVAPVVASLIRMSGQIIALIKPQFEAGRGNVGKGGVVREPDIHQQVLQNICDLAVRTGLSVEGLTYSPVRGPAGNIEFLVWLQKESDPSSSIEYPISSIQKVVSEAHTVI